MVYVGTGETSARAQTRSPAPRWAASASCRPGPAGAGGRARPLGARSAEPARQGRVPHRAQPGGSGVVAATTAGLFERPAGAGADDGLDARGRHALRHARRTSAPTCCGRAATARGPSGCGSGCSSGAQVGLWVRDGRPDRTSRASSRRRWRCRGVPCWPRRLRSRRSRRTRSTSSATTVATAHRACSASPARRPRVPVATLVTDVPDVLGNAGLLRHRARGAPDAEGPCRARRQRLPGRHPSGNTMLNSGNTDDGADRRRRRGRQRRCADLRPAGRAEDDRRRRACRRARPRLQQGRRAAVGGLRRRRVPLRPPRPAGRLRRDERRPGA